MRSPFVFKFSFPERAAPGLELGVTMNSRIASEERVHFRERLQEVLRRARIPVRASRVAHEFNLRADGATVTTHAVRKWLAGDAIPTHERLVILADWLGVVAAVR